MGIKKKALRETYRMLIEAVYAKWNAEKFDDVPRLMEKYKDQEAEIYDRIVRKYVFCRPQKDWQPLVEAMYARFNPGKLQELDGIFAKYKDSEAGLYRALCDKYLPTLTKDDEPLVFKVWGTDASSEAIAIKDLKEAEELVRLVSPSQEDGQSNGRTLPSREHLESRANQLGAAEEVLNFMDKEQKRSGRVKDFIEAFPPTIPRQADRESMAGVNDLPDVPAITGHLTQVEEKKKSRRTNSSLRPKAAPRPPETLVHSDAAVGPGQVLDPKSQRTAVTHVAKTKRQKRHQKENGQEEKVEGLQGRRKKRRQAPLIQDEPILTDSNLEIRRQQLKDKLLELKTQISIQAPSNAPVDSHESLRIMRRQPACDEFDGRASSYSYSDDEDGVTSAKTEAEQAQNRTVVLRNQLEAQLRQKLVNSFAK